MSRHLLELIAGPAWILLVAWALVSALVWFFAIGPHFPGRGATPIAGATTPWFGKEHRAQLDTYRQICVRENRSLIWWRFIHVSLVAWPTAMFLAVLATILMIY